MRILKWLAYLIGIIIIIAAVLAFLNFDKLKRLNTVNTLFSEEKIVSNFSGLKDIFFSTPIPVSGDAFTWEEALSDLPNNFKVGENNVAIEDWLTQSKTTSLVVIQDGKLAYETYRLGTNKDDLRISWSVAKSFLSAAFGIAVNDGVVDLAKPVDSYVEQLKGTAYEGVTVLNVLNMSSGVKFNEDYLDFWSDINKMGRILALGGSMDDFAADIDERIQEQGTFRKYTSIDTHVLAMVLRSATGMTLTNYLGEKVITPLGFNKQPHYVTDSQGNAFALGGLNITSRDYAKFGQMFLDNGSLNGTQIVPSGWVSASTAISAPKPAEADGFDYGYQWWVPSDSPQNGGDYLARGIYGQYIYINPANKTVIIKTSANKKFREVVMNGELNHGVNKQMFRAISKHVAN